jgi:hypothetical protein
MKNKARELIRTIMSDPKRAEDGELANDLLREFHRGYPVDNLRPLLCSPQVEVVKTAVFIAAELGNKAAPLLPAVFQLLNHPARWVRSDVIDTLLTCSTGRNQLEIAGVVSMLDDPDSAIRWKVMEFLSLVSLEQLRAGLEHFEMTKPDSPHIHGLRLLASDEGRNLERLASLVRSDNPMHRKYGVVAAARLGTTRNEPLVFASFIDDDDVKEFARSVLQLRK